MPSLQVFRRAYMQGYGSDRGPWRYRLFPEHELRAQILKRCTTNISSDGRSLAASLQPHVSSVNEDRYLIMDLSLPNGVWSLNCVFDGHGGHETADYLVSELPSLLMAGLLPTVTNLEGVSDVLTRAIFDVDEAITRDFLKIFPEEVDEIATMSDITVKARVNDQSSGGLNHQKALRCLRGSTILLTLVDPTKKHLWVLNLGDGLVVLGSRRDANSQWNASILSDNHNGNNPAEADRIKQQHPGEPECIFDDRVLGNLAVTRAVGDHSFKLPRIYAEKIFLNVEPGFRVPAAIESFIPRNLSPPYVSNLASVRYVDLHEQSSCDCFILMCSDGLVDLYMDDPDHVESLTSLVQKWVGIVGDVVKDDIQEAMLRLLRHALGAEDIDSVSCMLNVDMPVPYMDDTTVILQVL
ncbi:phosphatase 2C-like domain-containing protein [Suillus fuscotomentosus]|uniref:Phosphatase 2C-like domain-containing protein n=1 Tax=Suillus fuscotomentosus TaxID=1912939 RepID=A0AAD4DZK1_9AGAM|nr:phosphatase 2C-like domain-containing protein [Suillus fuscotomentosus]KAG1896995.1 phosphatase 2C-like domain-containing protein [Suillus fuscotomentosus]